MWVLNRATAGGGSDSDTLARAPTVRVHVHVHGSVAVARKALPYHLAELYGSGGVSNAHWGCIGDDDATQDYDAYGDDRDEDAGEGWEAGGSGVRRRERQRGG
jgi:hypothetical protein